MKKTKFRWLKILSIVAASIIALIILIPILATAVISSPKMKPTINRICTSFVPHGTIEIDTISLSVFEEFPYLSLKLSNGKVVSNAFDDDSLNILYGEVAPDDAHNLLSFDQLVVSVNIPQLIFGKIDVRRIRLTRPEIYAYISPWGRPNWDIFSSDTTVTESSEEESSINLNVRRISLRDAHLLYDDSQNMDSFEANIGRFMVRGRFGLDMDKLAIDRFRLSKSDFVLYMEETQSLAEVHIDSLRISSVEDDLYDLAFASSSNLMMESKVYTENFPVNIKGRIGVDITDPTNYQLDSTYITIAESPILLNGRASILDDAVFTNMRCSIDRLSLGKVLPYLNTQAFPQLKGMSTNLSVSLQAEAMGRYEMESGRLPALKADFKIHKGKLHYPGIDVDVDRLAFDSFINYDPYNVDSTSILIKKMDVDATGLKLDASGSGVNILNDPSMDLKIKGSADLTTLSRIFLKDMGIATIGDMSIDMKAKFKLSDISLTQIGNTTVIGRFKSDNLLLDMPNDTIHALMRGVTLTFGSTENKRDTIIEQGLQTLVVSFRADSADVNYKDEMMINLSKARIAAKSAADGFSGDTTKIHPLLGKVDAERLSITTADSIRIRGRNIKASATLLPSKDSASVPVITVKTDSRSLSYRDAQSWYSVRNSTINFEGTLAKAVMEKMMKDPVLQARRARWLDSLQRIYPGIQRDSLMAYSRRMNPAGKDALGDEGNIDMSVDRSISDLLNKWNVNCSVKAQGGRIITPYFPLRNRLGNTDISFTTNEVKFNDTHIQSGHTSIAVTGRIWGIRRALTRKGKLRADLLINSDTLNVNELLRAADAASTYMSSEESFKDSLSALQDEEEIQKALAQNVDSIAPTPLIIVPGNIDMKLGLHVGYGEYGSIILDDISGNLLARDRCLQIKDLKAITEAGDMTLTALYATKTKEDVNTGFDLEMRNMQVEKLIDLIPSVDTLLPMLRSFRGTISCQLAATADIDTSMNIILPSLNGVARIKGKELVLLDGQTFAEIAKMLRFKNRETNIIDSISVEMLVADNKVEMFPFIMQMDRYQAAVSGVQNLDMSFKYHISVIKSPLPMRLGINIFGDNFDKMKFRLGKPKYKNANIPSYTRVIDSSRVNLIHSINDIFIKGVDVRAISDVSIVPKEDSIMKAADLPELETLSAEDSLILKKEGIIPKKPAAPSNASPSVIEKPTSQALMPPKEHLWLENRRRVLSSAS